MMSKSRPKHPQNNPQSPQASSPDLLINSSGQVMLAIFSFLDLKSLENLQQTNRHMRELFLTVLWNNLFIVTFRIPVPHYGGLSRHELFRRKYFEKFPEELKQYNIMLKNKRLEEIRRQGLRERRERERIKKNDEKFETNLKLLKDIQKWEIRILFGLFLLRVGSLLGEAFSYDFTFACNASDERRCTDFSQQQLLKSGVIAGGKVITLVYMNFCEDFDFTERTRYQIAAQSWKTILKIILVTAAIIYEIGVYIDLIESPCNGYSSKNDFGTCDITVNFGPKVYLFNAFAVFCLGLFHSFKLYLECYARDRIPKRKLWRPLLGGDDLEDDD